MSITVVGVGPEAYKEKDRMIEMAGDKGRVLFDGNYSSLRRHSNDVLQGMCGTFLLCIPAFR